jgi:protein MpaA
VLLTTRGGIGRVLADLAGGPLMAWEHAANGPRVYVSDGIHGNEPAGPLAALELMKAGFFAPDIHGLLCPAPSPDGLAAGTRGNGSGLDLNRDYWKPRAMRRWPNA